MVTDTIRKDQRADYAKNGRFNCLDERCCVRACAAVTSRNERTIVKECPQVGHITASGVCDGTSAVGESSLPDAKQNCAA